MAVKIVFFDALHTIVQPRIPIFEQASLIILSVVSTMLHPIGDARSTPSFGAQLALVIYDSILGYYHRVLTPKFGPLNLALLKNSFKRALREVQQERPAYANGKTEPVEGDAVRSWWKEVVRKTALGAGADPQKMSLKSTSDVTETDKHLDDAVTELLHIFSSKEGYKLSKGVLQTISSLKTELDIRSGLVSNCDTRILHALEDLEIATYLNPMVISELEKFEKPDPRMWQVACQRSGLDVGEAVHVGDDFDADVVGAMQAGVKAIWYRPPGQDNDKDDMERVVPKDVMVVEKLVDVVDIVRRWNQGRT